MKLLSVFCFLLSALAALGQNPAWLGSAAVSPAIIDATLISWWPLNEGIGTNIADSGSVPHAGFVQGTANWNTGQSGLGGLWFDGSANTIKFASYTNANVFSNTTWTVTYWYNATNAAGLVVGNAPGSSGSGWWVDVGFGSSGNLSAYTKSATGDATHRTSSGLTVNDGQWHFVTTVFTVDMQVTNNNNFAIWFDAVTNSTTSIVFTTLPQDGTTTMYVGSRAGSAGRFRGSLDDIRIYSRALSGSEITNLFSAGAK